MRPPPPRSAQGGGAFEERAFGVLCPNSSIVMFVCRGSQHSQGQGYKTVPSPAKTRVWGPPPEIIDHEELISCNLSPIYNRFFKVNFKSIR